MFCLFHKLKICLIISFCVFFLSRTAFAIPALSGSTGIITQPTAETLNAGNICVGVWSVSDSTGTIVPVTITIGLGTFLEAYGSFPNITLNGDENDNPRGFANVGMKLRFWGKRSASFKLALEGEMRRWVSDDINTDGLTDTVTRLVASYKLGRFGFHLNGGYSANEDPVGGGIADQTLYGGAVEFLPTERLRLVAEYAAQTHRDWISYNAGVDGPSEATFALQYHLSPHLTLNLGMVSGLNDATDEWKLIFGFSSCQGIGTYQRELPRPVSSADTAEEKKEIKKIIKVRMLKPLRGTVQGLQTAPLAPVTKLEVPVVTGEEIVLTPSDRLTIAGAQTLKALSVAPVGSAPALSAPANLAQDIVTATSAAASAVTAGSIVIPGVLSGGRSYQLNEFVDIEGDVAIDSGHLVAQKISEELLYQANFTQVRMGTDALVVEFYHNYQQDLPVWIEGDVQYELSDTLAPPNKLITLKINRTAGSINPFKLHLGAESEVFEFWIQTVESAKERRIQQPKLVTKPVAAPAPVRAVPLEPVVARPNVNFSTGKPISAKVYRKFRLPGFEFGFDQSTLSPETIAALDQVAEQLRKDNKWFFLRIDGHTDSVGSEQYNQDLSLQRAISAATRLAVSHGIESERIFIKGFGESTPIDDNLTKEGRAANRRVEILVLIPN